MTCSPDLIVQAADEMISRVLLFSSMAGTEMVTSVRRSLSGVSSRTRLPDFLLSLFDGRYVLVKGQQTFRAGLPFRQRRIYIDEVGHGVLDFAEAVGNLHQAA